MKDFIRKEVHLDAKVTGRLQMLADKKKWSLKKYMETVLEKDSNKAMKQGINFIINK